ncbi:hypothetical protein ATY41_07950 [Leifsonia xyli subsp. xyli]|uniref:Uncharacterized protein n=2 Tax=Leifsonia xyli subsp. xyli TaxID=59736 RepID=Q6AEK5_LEIXX|nr:hypothetical protein [Leifsonia xyli]AAT89191.1 conserved hypothetical protein [Leifsonia xyli subsp. xyli str. CTCB07]ODA90894.1 hypothetical protein ATY41_07950 [Leifsonia xyli subsp. xyli]
MGNAFRRSPWQVSGLVLGLLYGLVFAVAVVAALVGARTLPDAAGVHGLLVVAGSIVVLGFVLLPLLFGLDDALVPQKFALFGLPARTVALGLLLSGLIGVPGFVLIVCGLATVVTWSRDAGSTSLVLVCAAVIVLTCVLASRVAAAAFPSALRPRGVKAIGVLLLALLPPAALLLVVAGGRDLLGAVNGLSGWLQWTPLGAVWSAPGSAASGDIGAALFQLLIALATLVALWFGWLALVGRALTAPARQPEARDEGGLGWFARIPGGATAAIAARSMTYWGRDARYWVALLIVPVFPAIAAVALLLAGLPPHYVSLVPLPLLCLFLGWTGHNDVAFDSTAVWLHIASGTRGFADRLGRTLPVAAVGVPVVAIGSLITAAAYGDGAILPAVAALSGALLVVGLGLSSVTSVLFPYPATRPGDSAFTQPQHSGASDALIQALSLCAVLVLSSPVLVFLVLGILIGPFWFGVAPVAAALIGFVTLFGGVWLGGRAFDRRGPELMAFAQRSD